MKKFLKNNPRLIKCVYGAAVGVAYQLSFQLSSYIGMQIILIFLTVTLYSVPMLFNTEIIKHYETDSIKKFIVSDLLFVFTPAVIASALTELVYIAAATVPAYTEGMGSIIFLCITALLTSCFWLGYLIINAIYKR